MCKYPEECQRKILRIKWRTFTNTVNVWIETVAFQVIYFSDKLHNTNNNGQIFIFLSTCTQSSSQNKFVPLIDLRTLYDVSDYIHGPHSTSLSWKICASFTSFPIHGYRSLYKDRTPDHVQGHSTHSSTYCAILLQRRRVNVQATYISRLTMCRLVLLHPFYAVCLEINELSLSSVRAISSSNRATIRVYVELWSRRTKHCRTNGALCNERWEYRLLRGQNLNNFSDERNKTNRKPRPTHVQRCKRDLLRIRNIVRRRGWGCGRWRHRINPKSISPGTSPGALAVVHRWKRRRVVGQKHTTIFHLLSLPWTRRHRVAKRKPVTIDACMRSTEPKGMKTVREERKEREEQTEREGKNERIFV